MVAYWPYTDIEIIAAFSDGKQLLQGLVVHRPDSILNNRIMPLGKNYCYIGCFQNVVIVLRLNYDFTSIESKI